jgi:hypothetical protein
MKISIVAALFVATVAIQPCASETDEIHVFIDPVLMRDLYYGYLVNAIKASLSAEPFVRHEKPGDDVLVITETDKPKIRDGNIEISVSFFRDRSHLADSVETCEAKKVSDCADQLALDAKSAAAIKD